MFTEIAEASKPQNESSNETTLETVPENSKPAGRGHSKSVSNAGSAGSNTTAATVTAAAIATAGAATAATTATTTTAADFPTKTDKPRPHQCMTCKRSFARLEHLKRHERSHTKEKPFECPECTRCFARRDLLLRHQQKLHMTTTPSARPKVGRRESSSSTMSTASKIRKSSQMHPNAANMRPRANTISHTGNPTLGMFPNGRMPMDGIHSPQPMMVFGCVLDDVHPAMQPSAIPGHHGAPIGLPKLNTSIANANMSVGLRTAPVFEGPFGMDTAFSPDTVNPSALHFAEAPPTAGLHSPSPFQEMPGMNSAQMTMSMDSGMMDWMGGFGHELTLMDTNDSNAIAGSSPSVVDSDSPGPGSEHILDRKANLVQHTAQWQTNPFPKGASALPEYMMDIGLGDAFPQGPPSPSVMPDYMDSQFANPQFHLQNPFVQPMTPHPPLMPHHYPPSMGHPDSPSTLASTTDTSARHSSVSSGHVISIPDGMRHAIMVTLAQPGAMFSQRKYSQPTISSPLSPGFASKAQAANNVPSTADLQRFVGAYVKYFHPHMPIFHIPTLSFDPPMSSGFQAGGRSHSPVFNVASGGGCLILAMSAIGALYEGEIEVSKALFNFSKRVLSTYLEERRKADLSSAFNSNANGAQSTPLWLVQAMLLNVVYGHMCGDKTAEINAHNHGAALVSLARAARLNVPSNKPGNGVVESREENWNPRGEDPAWYEWRVAEEKKRTLYAVFNVSSLLTFAYNHTPALKNTEILLDLPCDEDLWSAESADAWYVLGGGFAADQNNVPFNLALSNLLSARERQPIPMHQMSQAFCKPHAAEHQQRSDWPQAEFHASTFGCLVLINALHNYIWETRQRHFGRQWTTAETDDMHRQIEPALVAWQAVWASVHHHSVERPNPYGMGPLAADSIPLLDLAYLTLYVNLGRSKEYFWTRDFEEMSREIASGYELLQHANEEAEGGGTATANAPKQAQQPQPQEKQEQGGRSPKQSQKASRRERHLRKAAFHAANSMLLGARTGTTFADFSSRELPIQQAVGHFLCAQVLAEWVATLQERVGPYLGILGLDPIDFEAVPAVVLLDQEDVVLLRQIDEILSTAEMKMARDSSGRFQKGKETFESGSGVGMDQGQASYSPRILQVTGRMLDSSSVWPVMHLMNHGLGVQARFMKDRAERSRDNAQ